MAKQRSVDQQWREFETEMREIFELAGYECRGNIKLQGRQTDIWCNARNQLVSARVIVECKSTKGSDSLPLDYVTEFCNRLSLARGSGIAELGWILTNYRVPDNAWSVIRDAHLQEACNIFRPEELLSKLLNLPQYLHQLKLAMPESKTGYVDTKLSLIMALKPSYPEGKLFFDILNIWLADRGRPLFLLLGDFGQGKTTCCYEILRRYFNDPSYLAGRTPIYIRLRDVANQGYDLPALLRVCLQEQFGLHYVSFELLRYLSEKGHFIFLFDGLDEISYTVHWPAVFGALQQISRLAHKGNKLIVTTRPGAFPHGSSLLSSIGSLERLFAGGERSPYPGSTFIAASLHYFDTHQIKKVMQNFGLSDIDATFEKLRGIHDLEDLARRPITLKIILESWDAIEAGTIQGYADLYQIYTSKWLGRDAWRSNIESFSIELSRNLKEDFVCALAWAMIEKGVLEVKSSFVGDTIRNHCAMFDFVDELITAFTKEIIVCSFLDFRPDAAVSFAHKSFYEYFVARYLSKQTEQELLGLLEQRLYDREILLFLAQMVEWRKLSTRLAGDRVTASPIFSVNKLHLDSICGLSIDATVTIPQGCELYCVSTEPICITIDSSSPASVVLESQSMVELKLRDCIIEQVSLRCPSKLIFSAERSDISKVDIAQADRITVHMINSKMSGGTIENKGECKLFLHAAVSLRSVVFSRFAGLQIEKDSIALTSQEGRKIIKDMGGAFRYDVSSSIKRKRGKRIV